MAITWRDLPPSCLARVTARRSTPARSASHRRFVLQGRSLWSSDTVSNQAPNHARARTAQPRMLGPGHPPDGAGPKTGKPRDDASQSGPYTVPASTAATASGSRPARVTRMACANVNASAARTRMKRVRRLTFSLRGAEPACRRSVPLEAIVRRCYRDYLSWPNAK